MMRMSPTPLDRSVSPTRQMQQQIPETSSELSTIEKLQVGTRCSPENETISTGAGVADGGGAHIREQGIRPDVHLQYLILIQIQARSEVEVRDWNAKLLALQLRLKEVRVSFPYREPGICLH